MNNNKNEDGFTQTPLLEKDGAGFIMYSNKSAELTPLIKNSPRFRSPKGEDGFIALILIIIIASVTLVFGLTVALMSADETIASQGLMTAAITRTRAASCADDVIARLYNNSNLNSGTFSIAASVTNCNASLSGSGNLRGIVVRATSTDSFSRNFVYRANLNVNINTSPFTIITYKDILTE